MKTRINRLLTLLSLIVLSFVAAHAQYMTQTIHISVPFDFSVAEKTFPAGDYSVVRTTPYRIELRDSRSHVLATFITHTVLSQDAVRTTKVEFSTADGGHALRRVWLVGDSIGNELPVLHAPAAMAKVNAPKPGPGGGNK